MVNGETAPLGELHKEGRNPNAQQGSHSGRHQTHQGSLGKNKRSNLPAFGANAPQQGQLLDSLRHQNLERVSDNIARHNQRQPRKRRQHGQQGRTTARQLLHLPIRGLLPGQHLEILVRNRLLDAGNQLRRGCSGSGVHKQFRCRHCRRLQRRQPLMGERQHRNAHIHGGRTRRDPHNPHRYRL